MTVDRDVDSGNVVIMTLKIGASVKLIVVVVVTGKGVLVIQVDEGVMVTVVELAV